MAKNKTARCPYLSSYGGGYVRPDQWLTEKLCELIARGQSKELPDKFWNHPDWCKQFRRQVQLAASLLLIFDAETVAAVLNDRKLKNVRSFQAFKMVPFFYKELEKKQLEQDVKKAILKKAIKDNTEPSFTTTASAPHVPTCWSETVPTHQNKINRLSRLNELDGRKETRPVSDS
jgi:hypothetical protein